MWESIKQASSKIKSFLGALLNERALVAFVILLVALGSFGLGRLSKIYELKEDISITSFETP